MTQEELDALMNSDLSDAEGDLAAKEASEEAERSGSNMDEHDYRVSADSKWPPPPPTNDHKVVHQLDEVTQDSERKAGEIFDILEQISKISEEIETVGGGIKEDIERFKEVFGKLSSHFPNIATFKSELERTDAALEKIADLEEKAQGINDQTMMAMDVMQYQDIHRQKIERVINVMRALSKYMNSLFEGQIADEKRVGSAVHIHGDNTEDVVGDDDIEALIASFGQK
jgi:chemotaxis regulatin CheY-phosphate phosphatase CheZ